MSNIVEIDDYWINTDQVLYLRHAGPRRTVIFFHQTSLYVGLTPSEVVQKLKGYISPHDRPSDSSMLARKS